MGAWHRVFAVDHESFANLMQRSLGDLLISWLPEAAHLGEEKCSLLWDGVGDPQILFSSEGTVRFYSATLTKTTNKILDVESIQAEPQFAVPLGEFLANQASYQLGRVLMILSHSKSCDYVNCLVDGLRKWWLYSWFECAETTLGANSAEVLSLKAIFRKLIRFSDKDYPFHSLPFPVLPKSDDDFYMGAWSPEDTTAFLSCSKKLQQMKVKFPRYDYNRYPEMDEGWHEWVTQIIADAEAIHSKYPRTGIVSFYST